MCAGLIPVTPPRAVVWPLMFQEWRNLTFIHWRYPAGLLRPLLPGGLTLDLFDGTAWIGLTPFRVVNLRVPLLPIAPGLSEFPETNVRTYVRGPDGERGVWFLSLEANSLLAVLGARLMYGLPYRWAAMRLKFLHGFVEYTSRRHAPWRPASCRVRVEIGESIRTNSLDSFLTSRFRLFSQLLGKIVIADVEHEPWPLYRAQLVSVEQNLIENSGLPREQGAPIVCYSPGVAVRIDRPHLQPRQGRFDMHVEEECGQCRKD